MGTLRSKCELQSIKADFGEGEVEVFWRPMTLAEMDAIQTAKEKSAVASIVESLLRRARKADGTRMFNNHESHPDRLKVMGDFDPDEVIRVVSAMSKSEKEPDSGN